MAKAFAIAGFVLALLSMAMPHGMNFVLIWASMVCCSVAALKGYHVSVLGIVAVAALGLFPFSPISLAAIFGQAGRGDWSLVLLAAVPLLLPIIAMMIAPKGTARSRLSSAGE
jgi:hypothetical protein